MKQYTSPEQLRTDAFKLGAKVLKDGFKPNVIVAIWRGGSFAACCIHELLNYTLPYKVDHIAIRTSKYTGIDQTAPTVQVHNLGYLVERLQAHHKVLIVDDVYDTGLSIQAFYDTLNEKLGENLPTDIRVATIDFKPSRNKTNKVPDYYINLTSQWIIYPHELEGLTIDDIQQNYGTDIATIVQNCVDDQKQH